MIIFDEDDYVNFGFINQLVNCVINDACVINKEY